MLFCVCCLVLFWCGLASVVFVLQDFVLCSVGCYLCWCVVLVCFVVVLVGLPFFVCFVLCPVVPRACVSCVIGLVHVVLFCVALSCVDLGCFDVYHVVFVLFCVALVCCVLLGLSYCVVLSCACVSLFCLV